MIYYKALGEVFLQDQVGSPEKARCTCSSFLPTWVANHSAEFDSPCLFTSGLESRDSQKIRPKGRNKKVFCPFMYFFKCTLKTTFN